MFLNIFEILVISLLPFKLRRSYYFRYWCINFYEDIKLITWMDKYPSAIKRRLSVLTDAELAHYITMLKVYRCLSKG